MTPNKSLGQHWLKDDIYLDQIAASGELSKDDKVLEIGPGQGDLTRKLAGSAGSVVAVEFDADLARKLPGFMPDNVEVINQDFLQFDLSQLRNYKVVANIPYYISGEIIKKLVEADNKPSLAVLLVQKEVAERVSAEPGDLSVLSIATQIQADASVGEVVPADAFNPAPKVDSQVLILKPFETKKFEGDFDKLMKLVKTAFSSKRKKLSNTLGNLDGGLDALKELDLQDKRPQELSLDDWQELYNKLDN